jgi:hypothetical protein
VDGPGERFSRGAVVVALLPEDLDPGFQLGYRLAELEFAGWDAVAGLDLGVEQVLEVGVLVGELVTPEPGFFCQGDDGQLAD